MNRTELYREFKLCRLLVRPLDDGRAGRPSSLRGYSRQSASDTRTPGCSSSSSSAVVYDATDDADDDDDGDGDGSRAVVEDAPVTRAVFADDAENDAPTDAVVTSLEDKHQMSLQSMKELLLGSVSTAPFLVYIL